jgi:HPt (histidine-containing phosphotransfer) domain-containing protein
MNDFLTKPVQAQQLLQCVGRWCRLQLQAGMFPEAATQPVAGPASVGATGGAVATPVYDTNVLAGIADAGDPMVLRELLDMFQENARSMLAEMEAAAGHADWPALQKRAHALKGSAGQIGAVEMSRMAGALEGSLRRGQAASAGDVAGLRAALERFAAAAGSTATA